MKMILIGVALGILIGARKLIPERFIKLTGLLQTIFVMALIFSLGANLGATDDIFDILPYIGLKSAIFAAAAMVCSILFVYFVSKYILKEEKK